MTPRSFQLVVLADALCNMRMRRLDQSTTQGEVTPEALAHARARLRQIPGNACPACCEDAAGVLSECDDLLRTEAYSRYR